MLLVLTLPLVYSAIVVPLSPWEQVEVSLAMIGVALVASYRRGLRPLIVFLSCFASMRYFYWRVSSTLELTRPEDAVVSLLLLGAECYGVSILFLGYFQTIEPKRRTPPPLRRYPSVDVFIPTYNESPEIVRRTAIGALAIDYPHKRVYVLDDGRRKEMEQLAQELGCEYLTRPDNRHAKAGNLNHALTRSDGELIAIFDADHVPVRGFLRKTVGFFEDAKVALVQSAQHFFNPDPYERNLKLTGRIAPEQTFFYHVIQPGNDFWNSAFFCGSCAVVRRTALEAIGGFRTGTVTEDAHTALDLHARGFESVYLGLPLAAGLATETFAAHVTQRMRWARGMAQILRLDLPLLKRGLSLPQRLNYFNAMLHFFFGLPRLIMIAAPLSYLLAGVHPIKADVFAVFAYILPHVGLSALGNSLLSQSYRHSFWGGVYEVSIAPYTAGVTALALINPRLGKFDVTDKGTSLDAAHFDARTSRGTLLLLGLSAAALLVALPMRLFGFDPGTGDPNVLHAILINGLWALGNSVTLVAAACVAYEQPQQRRTPRVARRFACTLASPDVTLPEARLIDLSETGARVELLQACSVPERCQLELGSEHVPALRVEAVRRWSDWNASGRQEVGFEFVQPGAECHRRLVELIFSGDRGWLERTYPTDEPLRSFGYLVSTFWRVTAPRRPRTRRAPRIPGGVMVSLDGASGWGAALSPFGGRVERLPAVPAVGTDAALTLGLGDGSTWNTRARVVRSLAPGAADVELVWSSEAEREAFAHSLYAQPPRETRSRGRWPWSRLGISRA